MINGILLLLTKSKYFENLTHRNFHVNINSKENISHIKYIELFKDGIPSNCKDEKLLKLGNCIYELWMSEPIQNTFRMRTQFYFTNNMDHFFDRSKEIFDKNYLPTDKDVC